MKRKPKIVGSIKYSNRVVTDPLPSQSNELAIFNYYKFNLNKLLIDI